MTKFFTYTRQFENHSPQLDIALATDIEPEELVQSWNISGGKSWKYRLLVEMPISDSRKIEEFEDSGACHFNEHGLIPR